MHSSTVLCLSLVFGFGHFSFFRSYFSSLSLSHWDITIEFLCQVTLLWWLNKCLGNNSERPQENTLTPVATFRQILWPGVPLMTFLSERCIGHQHLRRGAHFNCNIEQACWPTSFRLGRGASVFNHPTRSEATPSPPLISQQRAPLPPFPSSPQCSDKTTCWRVAPKSTCHGRECFPFCACHCSGRPGCYTWSVPWVDRDTSTVLSKRKWKKKNRWDSPTAICVREWLQQTGCSASTLTHHLKSQKVMNVEL